MSSSSLEQLRHRHPKGLGELPELINLVRFFDSTNVNQQSHKPRDLALISYKGRLHVIRSLFFSVARAASKAGSSCEATSSCEGVSASSSLLARTSARSAEFVVSA